MGTSLLFILLHVHDMSKGKLGSEPFKQHFRHSLPNVAEMEESLASINIQILMIYLTLTEINGCFTLIRGCVKNFKKYIAYMSIQFYTQISQNLPITPKMEKAQITQYLSLLTDEKVTIASEIQ